MTDNWQDISSAPKDGTKVLLWTTTRSRSSDRRYVSEVGYSHLATIQVGEWDGADWNLVLIGEPTHWMPLPSPPTDPKEPVG